MSTNEFELNKVIHSPLRLRIMVKLYSKSLEFQQLRVQLKATSGNLSVQLHKLQDAGLIVTSKSFNKNMPKTLCEITPKGRQEFEYYRNIILHLLGAY